MSAINLTLPDEFIEAVASVVYARLSVERPSPSPWMTAKQTAEYIGCRVSRIHDLTHVGQIPFEKDGRRLLFHRDAIDAWIRQGGGKRP